MIFITRIIADLKDDLAVIYILLREEAWQALARYIGRLWAVLWKDGHFLWGWLCAVFQLVSLTDEARFVPFCRKMAIIAGMERVPVTLTVHCLLTGHLNSDESFRISKGPLSKMPFQHECHLSTTSELLQTKYSKCTIHIWSNQHWNPYSSVWNTNNVMCNSKRFYWIPYVCKIKTLSARTSHHVPFFFT